MKYLITIAILCISVALSAQGQSRSDLLKGDKLYKNGRYSEAALAYRKAKELLSNYTSTFNLGNAYFQMQNYEEAVPTFENAIDLAKDDISKSNAYYNLGNCHLKQDDPETAIKAYKEALKLNRSNEDIRSNLLFAQLMKDMQELQPQQEQQQQQQQDQQNQEQDQQDQEQQDQQAQQDSTQQQQQQPPEDQDSESPQDSLSQNQIDSLQQAQANSIDSTLLDKQSLDSLEAMQLLDVIQNKEQKIQEKLRKFNSNRKKPKKDW